MSERKTVVDFVARGENPDEWKIVLIEEGPWTGKIDAELRRVQDRLYGSVDAALEGRLAEQFPESHGKNIVIQLDCYNCPRAEMTRFFEKFSNGVLSQPSYMTALKKSQYVSGISFRINLESIS